MDMVRYFIIFMVYNFILHTMLYIHSKKEMTLSKSEFIYGFFFSLVHNIINSIKTYVFCNSVIERH